MTCVSGWAGDGWAVLASDRHTWAGARLVGEVDKILQLRTDLYPFLAAYCGDGAMRSLLTGLSWPSLSSRVDPESWARRAGELIVRSALERVPPLVAGDGHTQHWMDGTVLLAVRGQLFEVDGMADVIPIEGAVAIGSGTEYALGRMAHERPTSIEEACDVVIDATDAARIWSGSVGGPIDLATSDPTVTEIERRVA